MARKGNLERRKATKEAIERPIRVKRYKHFFLIVCEDEKTEPEYFEQFVALYQSSFTGQRVKKLDRLLWM